ncbi:MAG: hypothetical protein GY749_24130 [Desulfobacteraceae bacterium]|nr:hypothetical protein [Desulfobacteraceae bacterium]
MKPEEIEKTSFAITDEAEHYSSILIDNAVKNSLQPSGLWQELQGNIILEKCS